MQWIKNNKKYIGFILLVICLVLLFLVYTERKFDYYSIQEEKQITSRVNLFDQSVYRQELINTGEDISSLNIQFLSIGDTDSSIIIELYEDDSIISTWNVDTDTLSDNESKSLKLDHIHHMKKDSIYMCEIRCDEIREGSGVELAVCDNTDSQFYANGETISGQEILCSFICQNTKVKKLVLWIFAVVVFELLFLYKYDEIIKMSVILLFLMVIYSIICPVNFVPDEDMHFLRAYEIANVSLISKHVNDKGMAGDYMPAGLFRYNEKDAEIDPDTTNTYVFATSALYSPISYLPHAVGIKVVSLFTRRVRAIYYGGRIGHAIACFILCALSLVMIPYGKRILFLIMIFPMTLQEMISLSADGFTFAIITFLFSYILYIRHQEKPVSGKQMIILGLLCVSVALCKIVYVVALLLLFMIPKERFSSKKRLYMVKGGFLIIPIIINLIWLKISTGFLVEFQAGVDSPAQVKYILTHPVNYIGIIIRTFFSQGAKWLRDMMGQSLGAFSVEVSPLVWLTLLITLVYLICTDQEISYKCNLKDRIVWIFVFIAGSGLIATSLYVQWSPYKINEIYGIQGRYFIPILSMLCFFLAGNNTPSILKAETENTGKNTGAFYAISLFCNCFAMADILCYCVSNFYIS